WQETTPPHERVAHPADEVRKAAQEESH
ncbi:MAG: hypothetical protein ACJAQ3_000371, partial [Planctomycetota bacterium]